MGKEKVYCRECCHFWDGKTKFGPYPERCNSPDNGKPNYKSRRGIRLSPCQKNENNDCNWFEKRCGFWERLFR